MSAQVTLAGRLTRDPELRYSGQGKPFAKFAVVTARRLKNNQTEEWEEKDTSFWDCTAFGQIAENICESLPKGTAVIITGRMVQEKWQTSEGENRTSWRVIVDEAAPSLRWASVKLSSSDRTSATAGPWAGPRA